MEYQDTHLLLHFPIADVSAAVVAAHPDDQIIGMGGLLGRMNSALHIQLTDGCPRNPQFAIERGFKQTAEYSHARRLELINALKLANNRVNDICFMNLLDQEVMYSLIDTSDALARIFESESIKVVFTHPYEGGHQDHDAAAFAVYAACQIMKKRAQRVPYVVEFTSYHISPDLQISRGEFLSYLGCAELAVELSAEESALKQQMFHCFQTQMDVLRKFATKVEKFRRVPRYDFCTPPHKGKLLYERFWNISKDIFTGQVINALQILDIP